MQDYLYTTIHEFKSNISRYIRMLEAGTYRAMIVKRNKKPVVPCSCCSTCRI